MPPVAAVDVFSAWQVAEGLLHAGHVEAAICTLHGLLLAHSPFPLPLFEAEVLTRLRLAHCFVYFTANPDAAKKTLEDVLQRFEGLAMPAVALFSASSALAQLSKQKQRRSSSAATKTTTIAGDRSESGNRSSTAVDMISVDAVEMQRYAEQTVFEQRFPFSLHLLKCHVLRLLGEAWLRKSTTASSSSSSSFGGGGGSNYSSNINNKVFITHALQCFRDASVVVGTVLHRTRDWLGIKHDEQYHQQQSQQNVSGQRRQRGGQEGPQNSAGNAEDDNSELIKEEDRKTMTLLVWSTAAIRLASLQLSLRGAEAKALHGLACSSFAAAGSGLLSSVTDSASSGNHGGGDGSSCALDFAQELVQVTTRALRDFFVTVGASPSSSSSSSSSSVSLPPEHQLLTSLFARFDDRSLKRNNSDQQSLSANGGEAVAAVAIVDMKTKIAPDALLSPTLATVALHHIMGLLLCAPNSCSFRSRAEATLEAWSRALGSATSHDSANKKTSSPSAAFGSFALLWRFLLLLSNPDRATSSDVALLESLGTNPSPAAAAATVNSAAAFSHVNTKRINNSNKGSRADDHFEAPPPVLAFGGKKSINNSIKNADCEQSSGSVDDAAVLEWLGSAVIEPGTLFCASRLINMLRSISRFSSNSSRSSNNNSLLSSSSSQPVSPAVATNLNLNNNSNNDFNRSEDYLDMLNELMFCVEDQLRKLTSVPVPSSAATSTTSGRRSTATASDSSSSSSSSSSILLTATSYSEIKFLVAIKVCCYSEMALFDLVSQQDICSAASKLDTLRRYVVLFRQHTAHCRGTLHLLIAVLAMYLGDATAMQAHCEAAQDCEAERCGNTVLMLPDENEDADDNGSGKVKTSAVAASACASVNDALSWSPARDALLVEAIATYSLLRSATAAASAAAAAAAAANNSSLSSSSSSSSPSGSSSSSSNKKLQQSTALRMQLRQRFDDLVAAATSAIRDAEEIVMQEYAERENNNNKHDADISNRVVAPVRRIDNRIQLWKLLDAARCIEDLDGLQALIILRGIIETATPSAGAVPASSTSHPQPVGISVASQYILATALRLEAVAHHLSPDVTEETTARASRASLAASFRAAAAIEDEGCIVHCFAHALHTISSSALALTSSSACVGAAAATERQQRERQTELFSKVSKASEEYGAQVQLVRSGQGVSATVDGLINFLPGEPGYDNWILGTRGSTGGRSSTGGGGTTGFQSRLSV